MNWEHPDVQAEYRKDRGTRDQIGIIHSVSPRRLASDTSPCCFSFKKDLCPSNQVRNISPLTEEWIKKIWYVCTVESAYNAGDSGSIPGSGRSPGEGNGNPLQYSCLENSIDRGTWWATVHGVTKSQTQLSDSACMHACTDDSSSLGSASFKMRKFGG